MRIEGIDPRRAPWSVRPVFAALRRMLGKLPTPYRALAWRPGILWTTVMMTGALEASRAAERRIKRLVALRAAQMVGCPF